MLIILAAGVLLGDAACSPPTPPHSATPADPAALMHELRVCRNVDKAEAVPAGVVSACPRKNVEILVGVSREDLFNALGKPESCGIASDGRSSTSHSFHSRRHREQG
jgi:hypothetical protein